MPRSHEAQLRFQSSRVIHTEPLTAVTSALTWSRSEAVFIVSPMANSTTASVVTSMPSSRSITPKARRVWPVCRSMPIRPRPSPMNSAVSPRRAESPKAAETVTKARTMSAK
ncbi:hypothetical protein D9M68_985460 [compost metagenome]